MAKAEKKQHFALVIVIYLAGIFMGALDTGIVTPARTIIQSNLGVDATAGIWMITIYTLAYAASIPIMGKLADRYGRKYIYLTSILLFGIGSLFCGLSQNFGGFAMLLAARAVQAIGGGGIIPVATAEFGTTFPPEKRGMALGLVGGVFGVANIFGASAGSAILDLFGHNNWQFIFYINVPITVFIVAAGLFSLENRKTVNTSKIDGFGIAILVIMILSLLYGLKNLDFFNFGGTIVSETVYPFLALFAVLLPAFIWVERKAQDPVINLKYFTNRNIAFTLLISFVSGFIMMGVIFVPQLSENALKMASGSGGYLVIILGIFSGVGAPISGRLIDRFGVKVVLGFGFAISIIGCAFLIFVTTAFPGLVTVLIGLMLVGIGMGFTIGTPLNYMMLANTDERESNSSLATLSLLRSIGTAIAPAIMVGFIAHAGVSVQKNVMNLLPNEVTVPKLPYAQEITDKIGKLKSDPNMKDRMSGFEIPDLASMTTVKIDMSGSGGELPADLLELMESSDVTNITSNAKTLAARMFAEKTPDVVKNIQEGISKGIDGAGAGLPDMKDGLKKMQEGYDGAGKGLDGMNTALEAQKGALAQLQSVSDMFAKMGNPPLPPNMSIADMIPPFVKTNIPQSALDELAKIKSADELHAQIAQLKTAVLSLETKIADTAKSRQSMQDAMAAMKAAMKDVEDLQAKMTVLKDAVPSAFETAKNNYIAAIGEKAPEIEKVFQSTLNEGFKNVYLTSAIASLIALFFLCFYSRKREHAIENAAKGNE